jgi:hypothetical protein
MNNPKNNFLKILFSLASSFVLATIIWILWGLITPGDYFGNGSVLIIVSLILSLIFGFVLGYSLYSNKILFIFVILFAIACIIFWIFVPSGWWASGPPMPNPSINI